MNSQDHALPTSDDPFDAEAFMNEAVEGVGSTQVTPIPAGDYFALIDDGEKAITITPFNDKETGEARARLNVAFNIIDDDGRIKAAIDGREPRHIQTYFLDVTRDSSTGKLKLDMGKGKNVSLNRLRDAVGQNTGVAWAPPMLKGAGPLKIKLIVEPDKQDKTILRNRITTVGKPSA